MMFKRTDVDGDVFTAEVHQHESDRPWVVFQASSSGAGLFREDLIELRDWLADVIDPGGNIDPAPAPLTAADVRAIASEVVAEALAQREAPAGATFCEIPGCPKFPATAKHFQHDPEPTGWDAKSLIHVHDPEPRDVGHPGPVTLAQALADPSPVGMDALWGQDTTAKTVTFPQCGLCGKEWSDGHGQPGDPCTAAPKQLVGCECGHGWGAHTALGCRVRDDHGVFVDDCTRRPPAEPTCECGHRTALHFPGNGCAGRKTGAVHLPCPCMVIR